MADKSPTENPDDTFRRLVYNGGLARFVFDSLEAGGTVNLRNMHGYDHKVRVGIGTTVRDLRRAYDTYVHTASSLSATPPTGPARRLMFGPIVLQDHRTLLYYKIPAGAEVRVATGPVGAPGELAAPPSLEECLQTAQDGFLEQFWRKDARRRATPAITFGF